MMSVKEYAQDTNCSVAEILKKCEELGIDVRSGSDELSEDDIIILDNTIIVDEKIASYFYKSEKSARNDRGYGMWDCLFYKNCSQCTDEPTVDSLYFYQYAVFILWWQQHICLLHSIRIGT